MKLSVVFTIIAVSLMPTFVSSDEPCEQFLDMLRESGYHDIALDYLTEMESSRLATRQFLQTLPFEKAQTLIQSTTTLRDREQIETRLSQAEQLLKQSESTARDPELIARAQDYQGDLLFRRARICLNLADNNRLTASEKSEQIGQAQKYLSKALTAFGRAKESYKSIINDFQVDFRDAQSKRTLKRLREIFTVVRVKLPQILEMNAGMLAEDDPQRQQYLETAVAEFEKLWIQYPNYAAGLDSCLYAARCNYKLNKYSEAISFLQQIFNLSNNSTLLTLKRRAMVLAADCWAKTSPYPYDEVIANFEPVSARLTRREQRQNDWQRVQLELARAYHAKAVDLENGDPSDGRIKNFQREAAKLIKSVARAPGDQRELARQLMSQWNLNVATESVAEAKPIVTFADAKQRGLDLIAEIESVNADAAQLRRQQPGSSKANLPADLQEIEQRLNSLTEECLSVFERAMLLADSSVTREDLNQIRYLQSVCYFFQHKFFEAGLIGEFLVNRYPNVAFSRQAGEIAVRSYAVLHDQSVDGERSFERERLSDLAGKIVDRWPGSNEATEAATRLTHLILAGSDINDEDIQTAKELIGSVPANSIERAALDVKLGTKLWFDYRKRKTAGTEDDDQLETRLAIATEYLAAGVCRFNVGNLRMEAAWGALFLVNAYLESDNLDAALKQLESEPVAPIDLVKQKNSVVIESGKMDLFVSETYKTAGKTYLAALSQFPGDGSQWTDKSLSVVRAMNARADKNGDANAKQDVLNMYGLIAIQLESRLESSLDVGQQKQFVSNLNRFLETLQAESRDPNTIIWAGKTLMTLGDSYTAQSMYAEAKPFYQSAISALDRAAELGIKDEKMLNELKRQQAIAKRGTGKFEESYNDFVALLKQSPNAWQIQIDVAKTLQLWGTTTRTLAPLAKALGGTERYQDPKTRRQKNLVWGWSRLADALKSNPKLESSYYKCLLGAVETRFEYGLIEKNQKVVAAALKRLNIAKTKDQTLGGPVWKARFDKLEERIKQQMETM